MADDQGQPHGGQVTAEATTPAPTQSSALPGGPWVPFWLVRLGAIGWRVLVVAALGLVVLAILAVIATVTASIALALVVSAAFAPLVLRLRSGGWPRTRAAGTATLLAAAILGTVLVVAAYVLVTYGPPLVEAVLQGLEALEDEAADMAIPPEILDAIRRLAEAAQDQVATLALDIASTAATWFTILLFGLFTTFFLLQDGDRAWAWLTQAASERRRAAATESGRRGLAEVGGYLRTVAALAFVEAVVDLVLMVLFGVPLAVPLATLVFVGGFIPFLGGILATAAVLLAALASIGLEMTLLLGVLIVVANVFEDRFIGRVARITAVRVNPAVLLIALPIGAIAGGLLGLLLAGPVVAFATALGGSVVDVVRPDLDEDAEGEGPVVVPDWLDVLAQWSWRLLVGIGLVTIVVAAIIQVPVILLPVIIATVLAATFAPVVRILLRRGWGTSLAAATVTAAVYVGISAIVLVTLASMVNGAQSIVGDAGDGASTVDDALGGLLGSLESLVSAVGGGLTGAVAVVGREVFGLVLAAITGAILTFFFLRDGQAAWRVVTRPLAPWRRRKADAAFGRAVSVLGGYIIGTGAISAFGAATQLVIMVVLGIPLAVPLAVLSFFGGFIPYIGSLLTTGFALLVTIAYGDTTDIAVMLVFTLVFNIVQGNIVAPLVYGRAVHIHPAVVLLAIPAGSAVAGVLGMFLVVPFLGIVATTWRTVLEVMGEPPPTQPGPLASEMAASDPPGPVDAAGPGPDDGAGDG